MPASENAASDQVSRKKPRESPKTRGSIRMTSGIASGVACMDVLICPDACYDAEGCPPEAGKEERRRYLSRVIRSSIFSDIRSSAGDLIRPAILA